MMRAKAALRDYCRNSIQAVRKAAGGRNKRVSDRPKGVSQWALQQHGKGSQRHCQSATAALTGRFGRKLGALPVQQPAGHGA